jgi:Holliday junction resolvase
VYDPSGSIVLVVQSGDGLLANALRGHGRDVVAFGHDEERLTDRIAGSGRACLVVEIESTGTNGFLLNKKFKSDGRLRAIPIVLFSTEVDDATFDQHKKLRTRADSYVVGDDPAKISDAVLSLLSSSRSG